MVCLKKGRVVNLKFLNYATFFVVKNKILIISTVFLIFGLIFGILSFKKFDLLFNFIESYVEHYFSIRNSSKITEIFINSFFESFGLIFLIFYFGTSMFGIIFIPFLITLKGYLYGATAAFLYWKYSINGIALNAVLILPTAIFFIIALLLSSCEAFEFSFTLAYQTFSFGEYKNLSLYFKNYCYKHILFIVLLIISAITDALISVNFSTNFL